MKTLKDFFKKVSGILITKEFIFFFPLAVFTVAAFVLHSTVFVVADLIWLIPLSHEIGKKEID